MPDNLDPKYKRKNWIKYLLIFASLFTITCSISFAIVLEGDIEDIICLLTERCEPTSVPSTNEPEPPSPVPQGECTQTLTQGGIPSGGTYELTVDPNEFHLWSSADFCVEYLNDEISCEIGDIDKGFISIFLPIDNKVTKYQLYNLVPANNWHGIYQDCTPQERQGWMNNRAFSLASPPNCADGNGCGEIYIKTFIGNEVSSQRYEK